MNKQPGTLFNTKLVEVDVLTTYLPRHSSPNDRQYTFAYTISISNNASTTVQLLSRHWVITDGNGEVQEVRGEGVVGEQPHIQPGKFFRYTSGTNLPTPVGYMEGSFTMIELTEKAGNPAAHATFEIPVAAFTLHTPTALN